MAAKISRNLEGLAAEAKKSESFEDFKKNFVIKLKHGSYWHWTDDPNFSISHLKGPKDMSTVGSGQVDVGKLMVTSDLEGWSEYGGPKGRKYAALIDMSDVAPKDYYQVSRGFGNEFFVNSPQKAKVVKVYSREQAIRVAKERHRNLPQSEGALKEFYDSVVDQPRTRPPATIESADAMAAEIGKRAEAKSRASQPIKGTKAPTGKYYDAIREKNSK